MNHVTCYESDSSHWAKLQHSTGLERIFQPIRALEFITGHVVYNLAYNQILQTKETIFEY
jgi:hypothetical protein